VVFDTHGWERQEMRSEKQIREVDAQKWFDENVYEDWTWEGMLEKFIEWLLEDSEK